MVWKAGTWPHVLLTAALLIMASALHAQLPGRGTAHRAPWSAESTRFCINYSLTPDAGDLQQYDLCIVAVNAQLELAPMRTMGCEMLAYASLVEVRPGTPEAEAAAKLGIPTVGANDAWQSSVLDVTHPAWPQWVLETLARPAWKRGFHGLFLDTLDSVELITRLHPEKKTACHAALVDVIKTLRKESPAGRLLLNRGFPLLDDLAGVADGVLIESVYQTWDGAEKSYRAVTEADTKWLLDRALEVKQKGLPVLVVDYVAPEAVSLAEKTAERIKALDCIPFISTPELQGYTHPVRDKKRWQLHESTCQ